MKPRLFTQQFLRDELIPYFKKWESSAKARIDFSKEAINLMMLSRETRDGINISGIYYMSD